MLLKNTQHFVGKQVREVKRCIQSLEHILEFYFGVKLFKNLKNNNHYFTPSYNIRRIIIEFDLENDRVGVLRQKKTHIETNLDILNM